MLQTKTLQQTAHLESLGSSLQHFTPKAVERVIALFRPLLPAGVSMPDVALVLQLLLQLLMDAGTQVIESNWQRHEESVANRRGRSGGWRSPRRARIRPDPIAPGVSRRTPSPPAAGHGRWGVAARPWSTGARSSPACRGDRSSRHAGAW